MEEQKERFGWGGAKSAGSRALGVVVGFGVRALVALVVKQ